jgi:hypothetical protein
MKIDEANKRNETKKFFEEVKYFNQRQSTLPINCKDSDNNYFLRESAHEDGKIVSPTHRPPLPSENTPGTHCC